MLARMIEYEEPEREMTHHDLTVPSVTSITINHDDCHDYMINDVRRGSPRLGGSSSVGRQTGEPDDNYANTQLRITQELETDLRLDRSSEGEFSGICPPRGCGGVGCDGDDYSVRL